MCLFNRPSRLKAGLKGKNFFTGDVLKNGGLGFKIALIVRRTQYQDSRIVVVGRRFHHQFKHFSPRGNDSRAFYSFVNIETVFCRIEAKGSF